MTPGVPDRINEESLKLRIAALLNRLADSYPLLGRFFWHAARLCWWTASLQLRSRLVERARSKARSNREAAQAAELPAPVSCVRCGSSNRPIYLNPSDLRAVELVRSNGNFNPTALKIWQGLVLDESWTHIVDIGANYGEMLVGVDFDPDTRLIAVEPNPRILPYLERTLAEARVHATIVRSAVSEKKGTAQLLIDNRWSGTTRLAKPDEQPSAAHIEPIVVETTTLAALLGDASPTARALVKIDVEGHEAKVLRGCREVLDRLDRFEALIEIAHIDPDDQRWIFDRFDVRAYDLVAEILVPVEPNTPEAFSAMASGGRFYPTDVVVRPKSSL